MVKPFHSSFGVSRRESLQQLGTGMGLLGLADVLAQEGALANSAAHNTVSPLAPKPSHFAP